MSVKPFKALRRFCLDCQGGNPAAVRSCPDLHCRLYPLRMGPAQIPEQNFPPAPAPLRLIRAHCLVCAGGRGEVRACDAKEDCPLWSYRFGVLPLTYRRVSLRRKAYRETLLLPGFEDWRYRSRKP